MYHYTTGRCLKHITNEGVIRPSRGWITDTEIPVVWFTQSTEWEETANKLWFGPIDGQQRRVWLDRTATHYLDGGLARISVSDNIVRHRWKDYRKIAGCPQSIVRSLAMTAIQVGSQPADWRFTLEPVPQAEWEAIEYFNGRSWQSQNVQIGVSEKKRQEHIRRCTVRRQHTL